jgi:hypothetical protein
MFTVQVLQRIGPLPRGEVYLTCQKLLETETYLTFAADRRMLIQEYQAGDLRAPRTPLSTRFGFVSCLTVETRQENMIVTCCTKLQSTRPASSFSKNINE